MSDNNFYNEMSNDKALVKYSRRFIKAEFDKIKKGYKPKELDDRWLIIYESDWLFFYRSWSGDCIFKISFFQDENSYYVREAWASRDKNTYDYSDAESDVAFMNELIDMFLLNS